MTTYQPINCDIHSQYELLIMQGKRLEWHYRDDQGLEFSTHGVPVNLFTRNKEEFIVITKDDHSSVTIRLDKIIAYQ